MLEVEKPPAPDLRQPRAGRALLQATEPFAAEDRARSWWYLLSTVSLMVLALVAAAQAPWWPLQLALAPLGGLLMMRAFILYHDYMHGAILQGSWAARLILYAVGTLVLTPPRSWRHSHNHHHAHVGKLEATAIGSFPILTIDMWRAASPATRLGYRIARHPLTIAAAYATVFFWSICLETFIRNPKRYWDGIVVLAVQGALMATVAWFGGAGALVFGLLLPMAFAAVTGAYLFYAQHNYVGVRILPAAQWSYDHAALESSSFMKLGPLMRWFSGNIGYHHVHHLNPAVPFYRLPDAMAAIPELQHPVATSLRPRDIFSCLRLKLWDPAHQRMVGYGEAS